MQRMRLSQRKWRGQKLHIKGTLGDIYDIESAKDKTLEVDSNLERREKIFALYCKMKKTHSWKLFALYLYDEKKKASTGQTILEKFFYKETKHCNSVSNILNKLEN